MRKKLIFIVALFIFFLIINIFRSHGSLNHTETTSTEQIPSKTLKQYEQELRICYNSNRNEEEVLKCINNIFKKKVGLQELQLYNLKIELKGKQFDFSQNKILVEKLSQAQAELELMQKKQERFLEIQKANKDTKTALKLENAVLIAKSKVQSYELKLLETQL